MAHDMGHGAGMDMHAMVRDMRNRFWISLVFSVPIFVYSPMGMDFVRLKPPFGLDLNVFLFLLASAAIIYPAWPFVVGAVRALRERGVRFLSVPPAYYEEARARMAGIELPWAQLAELGILVDRDPEGHLLQIFTETVSGRPTVFFEIIQREGARGFGAGNFKALFEAIEREQARRGNL